MVTAVVCRPELSVGAAILGLRLTDSDEGDRTPKQWKPDGNAVSCNTSRCEYGIRQGQSGNQEGLPCPELRECFRNAASLGVK